jgi:type II secretory ATPase GspE/PulE/Tfp pilus assembly ATPase PilB-like protein
MPDTLASTLQRLDVRSPQYATEFVAALLEAAATSGVSDVHLHPVEKSLEVRWRVDGVLQSVGMFARGEAADVVTRLKVLAQLLTYHSDVPQEGRLRDVPGGIEMRLSTFPTLHGERATIRLFAASEQHRYPDELGLPDDILRELDSLLQGSSGALVIAGPAGSGKTTTAYACLREIVRRSNGSRNIVTLEDPIESALAGASQSQVKPAAGFTLGAGLRSLLRQDPEVILVGEIRDRETAEGVFQAALTGHLVLSTFHAGSAVEAIARLIEMSIEPYSLRSGLQAVLCQRLVRRLCGCARPAEHDEELLGLNIPRGGAKIAGGCPRCLQTGYRGRALLAELLARRNGTLTGDLLQRTDTHSIGAAAIISGMVTLESRACEGVASGITSPAEVRRVLGTA